MKNRVKEIRESLGLNQEEFGEKLNVSKSAISLIESGKRNLSNRTISDMCRSFNINKTWLLTGNGEMFSDSKDDLDYLVGMYGDRVSPTIKAIVETMLTLDEDQQREFDVFVDRFLAAKERILKKDQD